MFVGSTVAGRALARVLAGALLLAAVSGASGQAFADEPGDPGPAACLDEQEAAFLQLINDYRRDQGVPALSVSKALNEASYLHSKDMADNDYFDHESLDGRSPQDRMAERGYDGGRTGENIAAGYPTAERVFDTWRDSPGHNKNMLSEDYDAIGIGLALNDSSEYGEYWTTDFGDEVDAAPECDDSGAVPPSGDAGSDTPAARDLRAV